MPGKQAVDSRRRDVALAVSKLRVAVQAIDRAYEESRTQALERLDALEAWARGEGEVPPRLGNVDDDPCAFPLAFTTADLALTVIEDDYPVRDWARVAAKNASGCICPLATVANRAVARAGIAELASRPEAVTPARSSRA